MTPRANEIFLIIQNDGNGSQCGLDYKHRCFLAKMSPGSQMAIDWLRMAQAVNHWLRKQGADVGNVADVLQAAAMAAEYYIQHVKEIDYV